MALSVAEDAMSGKLRAEFKQQYDAQVAPHLTRLALQHGLPHVLGRLMPDHDWRVEVGDDFRVQVWRDDEPLPQVEELHGALEGGRGRTCYPHRSTDRKGKPPHRVTKPARGSESNRLAVAGANP